MNNNIRLIFKDYEMYGGRSSLGRFINYVNENCKNKKNINKINKLYEEFMDLDNKVFIIKKDYYNFRNYVFNK